MRLYGKQVKIIFEDHSENTSAPFKTEASGKIEKECTGHYVLNSWDILHVDEPTRDSNSHVFSIIKSTISKILFAPVMLEYDPKKKLTIEKRKGETIIRYK